MVQFRCSRWRARAKNPHNKVVTHNRPNPQALVSRPRNPVTPRLLQPPRPRLPPPRQRLPLLHLPQPQWLTDDDLKLVSILLVDVWMWTPFMMLISLAGLNAIPKHIYEAAEIDRAGRFMVFRTITLPMCAPLLGLAVLLRATDALKQFDLVMAITGPFSPCPNAETGRLTLLAPVETTARSPLTDSIVPTGLPDVSLTAAPAFTAAPAARAAPLIRAAAEIPRKTFFRVTNLSLKSLYRRSQTHVDGLTHQFPGELVNKDDESSQEAVRGWR